MEIIVLDEICFDAPLEMFIQRMRIEKRPAIIEEVADLLEEAKPLARPKAMFTARAIEEFGDDFVIIGGQAFNSKCLREVLTNHKRVFPAVVTCGHELALWADGVDSPFSRFCAEAICEAAMINAQNALAEYAQKNMQAKKVEYILPGTLDWPIADQQKLFLLLGDTEPIGVTLTPSGTMRPIKSVSALYYETD